MSNFGRVTVDSFLLFVPSTEHQSVLPTRRKKARRRPSWLTPTLNTGISPPITHVPGVYSIEGGSVSCCAEAALAARTKADKKMPAVLMVNPRESGILRQNFSDRARCAEANR